MVNLLCLKWAMLKSKGWPPAKVMGLKNMLSSLPCHMERGRSRISPSRNGDAVPATAKSKRSPAVHRLYLPPLAQFSLQYWRSWQKCLVDSDYEAFLINILPIIWQIFSHCIIISARDMATLICKFWEPWKSNCRFKGFWTSLAWIWGLI